MTLTVTDLEVRVILDQGKEKVWAELVCVGALHLPRAGDPREGGPVPDPG